MYVALQTEPVTRIGNYRPKFIGYGFSTPRWRWLKRIVLWLAGRWFKPIYEQPPTTTTYRQVEVQYSRFADLCRGQMEWFMRHFGLTPKYVVMGPKQMFDVIEEFITDYPFIIPPGELIPISFKGMTLCVAPNFDGVLLLPDWEDLKP